MYFKHYFVAWEILRDDVDDFDRSTELWALDREQAVRLATHLDVAHYGPDVVGITFVDACINQ